MKKNFSKNDINLLVVFAVIFASIFAIVSIFNRDKPISSEKGKKILSDEDDKRDLLDAIKKGKHSVKTKQGTVNIV